MQSINMRRAAPLSQAFSSVTSSQIGASFDLCVLGAGQAGLAAASRGWDFGRRVAVVQDGAIGGATLNNGALSSKAMWQLSRQHDAHCNMMSRYANAACVVPDFSVIRETVNDTVQFKRDQFLQAFKGLQESKRYSVKEDGGGGSVSLFAGASAKFVTPNIVQLTITDEASAQLSASLTKNIPRADDGHIYLHASNFIIATGSRPRELTDYPVDGEYILTSDHVGSLKDFPSSLLILGAGVIGCEFATIFGNFQKTKVHLVNERRDRLLPTRTTTFPNLSNPIYAGLGLRSITEL